MKFIGTHENTLNYKKENVAWMVQMDDNHMIHQLHKVPYHMFSREPGGLPLFGSHPTSMFSQDTQEWLKDRSYNYILVNPVFEGQFVLSWKKDKKEARLNLIGEINRNHNVIECMKASTQSILDMTMHIMMHAKPDRNGNILSVQKFILNNRTSRNSIKRYA